MLKKMCSAAAFVLFLAALASAPAAQAEPGCGSAIPSNFTLSHDIGPCGSGGLEMNTSNVVLNLNGFKIYGGSSVGDGDGVIVDTGVTGVVIKNGTISAFDTGVRVVGGAHHVTMSALHILGNVGNGSTSGDGVYSPTGSDHVVVTHCDVENNGPFSGITLVGANNAVIATRVVANTTEGIHFSGSAGVVRGNTVQNNTQTGIVLVASSASAVANHVSGNGYSNTTFGIAVTGTGDVVKDNVLKYNAGSGIYTSGASGHFVENTAVHNAVFGSGFDLEDVNVSCGTDVWRRDTFKTRSQPCIH